VLVPFILPEVQVEAINLSSIKESSSSVIMLITYYICFSFVLYLVYISIRLFSRRFPTGEILADRGSRLFALSLQN
jgi:hypothetical protein